MGPTLRRRCTNHGGEGPLCADGVPTMGEGGTLCADGVPTMGENGSLFAPHIPHYTHGEAYTGYGTYIHTQGGIYTGCTYLHTHPGRHIYRVSLLVHPSGRHIYRDNPPCTPLREAYTRVYTLFSPQGGIYPCYTPVLTSGRLVGRHIPLFSLPKTVAPRPP